MWGKIQFTAIALYLDNLGMAEWLISAPFGTQYATPATSSYAPVPSYTYLLESDVTSNRIIITVPIWVVSQRHHSGA